MNRNKRASLTVLTVILIALLSGVTAWAFSTQWSTQFTEAGEPAPEGGVDLPDFDEYHIGSCDGDAGGQAHAVGGGILNMSVSDDDTACFGAYYRDNDSWGNTFPADRDVRVVWRYKYNNLEWMGTQAGQLTGRYGGPQYAGISGVRNSQKNMYHLESDGAWGSWDVNNPMWSDSATNVWHQTTFDFICDGKNMQWWMDGTSIHSVSDGPVLGAFDPARPYQIWMGNLLTSGGDGKRWTGFDMDYVYVYAVERPQMIAPIPGGKGTQAVSWDPVPNTTQPDGSAWGIQYQARVCTSATCASVLQTSPWQSGTGYTFTGLALNTTYFYQARAKWVGTPELTTCWGSAQSAMMGGDPVIGLTKTATAVAKPGGVIQYTLSVKNTGTGPATGVTVTDPIPAYLLNPAGISNGGSVQGSNVAWNLSSISAGGSVNLSWSGTVNASIPVSVSKINNSATACDDASHCASATASTTINQPALVVNKTATALVWPGGNVSYQITVRNSGNTSLTGVTVTDPIPNYVSNPTGVSSGGVIQGSNITWNLGTLSAGASVTVSWSGTIDADVPATVSQIINTATGTADGNLSDQGQATSAMGQPVLELDKTAPTKSGPGRTIAYQIAVRNTGEAQASGVIVTDPIPAYVTNPTDISHGGVVQGSDIVWNSGTLSAGVSLNLGWSGTVDPAVPPSKLTIENSATVCDNGERCAEDTAITELFKADAWFDKEANAYGWPGDTIAYTITLRNTSMVTLTNIAVRDPVPAGILNPRQIASSAGSALLSPFEGNIEIVWRPAELGPGKQAVLTWRGTVDPELADSRTAVRNVATLTTNEGVVRQAEGSTYIQHQGVTLTKAAPAEAGPGETVPYTITVRNPTLAPLSDVVVRDYIPEHVISPTNIAGGGVISSAGEIVWNVGELKPGASKVLTWRGVVDPLVPANETVIVNRAEASDNTIDTVETEASTELKLQNVRLSKSAPYNVTAGSTVVYTLTVENTGAATLYGLELRDPVPGYVLTPTTVTAGGTVEGNTAVVWRLASLGAGQTSVFQWRGTVDPNIPASQTSILNTAELATGGGLKRSAQARSYIGRPDLGLSKRASLEAGPGETVVYTLTVQNNGSGPLNGVTVVDAIPGYITGARNAGVGGEIQSDRIYWNVGALAPGASKVLTWQGTVDPLVPAGSSAILNRAEASDASGQTARAEASTELKLQNVRLSKSAPYNVTAGSTVVYTLTVENTGAATLYDLELTDPAPGYVLTPTTVTPGGVVEGNTAVVWRLASLNAGQTSVFQWRGTVDPNIPASQASILNTAELTTGGGLERSAQARSYIGRPELSLSKRASLEAGPGETVVYTVTVQNNGSGPLNGVTVMDAIPEYVTGARNAGVGGEIQSDRIYWNVGALAPGASKVLTWQGTVDPLIPADEAVIVNRAEASDASGQTARAEASTELKLQNVRLSKSAPYNVTAGSTITYQLSIENVGAATLYDLELADPAPGYVLTPTTVTPGGAVEGNTAVVWRLASLNAGQMVLFQWRGTVDPNIPASQTSILNTAELATGGGLKRSAQARSYIGRPELSLSKRASLEAGPGETVVYTVTVQNNGSGPLNGVTVVDAIPEYVTGARNAGVGSEIQSDRVYWNVGALSPGASKVLTWQGTVDPLIPADEAVIVNRAEASDASGQTARAEASTELKLQNVRLSKSAPYNVTVGSTVVYTLTVENTGAATLYDLELTDPAPGYVLTPTTVTAGGAVEGNTAVVWRLASLNAGQTSVFQWRGTVDPNIPASQASILNTAELATGGGLERSAQARSYIGRPELSLSKRASLEAGPGETVVYTVTVQNNGSGPLNGVTVVDAIPEYITGARNAGVGSEIQSDRIYWNVGTLTPGASKVLTWQGTVDPLIPANEAVIVNRAEASDASGQTARAEASTELKLQNVRLSKSAPYNVTAGSTITYQLSIENVGAATLYDLELTDPAPGYVLTPTVVTPGGAVEGNTAVVWRLASLNAGQTATFEWRGMVDPNIPASQASILNTAELTTGGGLERSAQARSSIGRPELGLSKQATLEAGPGETVVYTVTVQNNGSGPLNGVAVVDAIPAYVTDPRNFTLSGGQVRVGEVYWNVGTLAPGASKVLTWQGTVDPLIPADEAVIVNRAEASDSFGRTARAEATTELKAQNVRLSKSAPYKVAAGMGITYRLTLENTGEATLYDLELTDPAPEYVLDPVAVTAGGVFEGNATMVWQLESLAAGHTATFEWRGTVAPNIPASRTSILNTAELTTGGGLERSAQARSYIGLPELALTKRASIEAGPGEPIAYTLTARNTGQGILNGVEVYDFIPDYLIDARNAGRDGEIQADRIYWNVGTLNPGESQVLTWEGTVDPLIGANETGILNRAEASDASGQTVEAEATTELKVQDVRLTRSAPYSVMAGDTVVYRITVENTGAATLYALEVRDPVPAYVLNPAINAAGGSVEGNATVVWRLDSLPAGQTATVEWRGEIDPDIPAAQTAIAGTANLTTGGGLSRSAQARSYVGRPELTLTGWGTTEAGPGEPIAYALTVQNTGQGPLSDVEVFNPMPAYVINARAGGNGEVRADGVRWPVGTLEPGESRVLAWDGMIDPFVPADEINITSEAQARDGSGRVVETEVTTELKNQGARFSRNAPYSVAAGESITYRLVVENTGAATLYALEVRDPVPAYVLNPVAGTAGGILEGNTTMVWRLDSLPAGRTAILEWSGMVDPAIPAAQILNTASLVTGGGLSQSAQARSYVGRPELALTEWATVEAGPGDPVVYVLTVENTGQGPLAGGEVFAPIPEYIVDAREADNGGQVRADQVYWALGPLGAGESRTLSWLGTVDPFIETGVREIVSSARVVSSGLEDEAGAVTRVLGQRAYLYKTATAQVRPGGVVDYGIVIRNRGEATLRQVEVRDPLPGGIISAANISHGGVLEGNTELVWFLETIPAGEQVTLTWQGTVDPGISSGQGVIRNEVSLITGGGLELEASAESVVENTSERLQLLLRYDATVQAGPGETVSYTLTVQNAGGSDLPEVEVFAPIPEYIIDAREADNGGQVRADQVYWALGTLGADESRVLTWRGTVDPFIPEGIGEITGASRATSLEPADEAVVVTRVPTQRVYLYATATGLVWPGGVVDYGIVIRNRGGATLRQVEVRDPLPSGITGATNLSHGGEPEGNTELVWLLDAIPAGEQVVLTWQGAVDPALSSGQGVIRNEVSLVTGGGLEWEASAESTVLRPGLALRHDATVQAGPGETVVYTLTVRNAGGGPLPEVEVFAPIPEHITNAREADNGGQVQVNQVYWAIGTLGAGESRTLSWSGTVDLSIPRGVGEIVGTARASGAGLEDETRVTTRVPAQQASLYVTAPQQTWPGGVVDYGIVISNSGEATLRRVEVRDPLPNGIISAANVSHGGRLEGNKELVWLLDAIPAGEQVALTWQGTVDPALATGQRVIRNEVSLAAGSGLEREALVESTVLRPGLSLQYGATVQAGPGETVAYTLTVRNTGGSALPEVEVFAPIPEHIVDAREAASGGQVRADQVYWAIGALGAGESRALSWRGTVDPFTPEGVGEITARAQTSGAGLKDEAQVVTRVPAQRAYLYATATERVWPGGAVDYGIVIRNRGEAPMRQVEVRNPLPNGIISAANISHGGQLEGNRELAWLLDTIPAGEQVTLAWQGTVDPGISSGQGIIRNEVSLVTGSGLDLEASAESVVENNSERLQLLLRYDATIQAGPGETVSYTLTVRNAGGSDLPEVEVFAPIPEYITNAREADNGGQVRADQVYWALGTLGAGESRALGWRGTVDPFIPEGEGEITALAQTSGAGLEDEARVVTRVPAQRVYLYATATERVWPGGAVDYGIVIRNRGEVSLREVEVRNPLPNGITGAANVSHGGELEGNTGLVWFLETIPAGEQVALTWRGTIDPALASGQKGIRNEVSLAAGSGLEREASAESTVLRPGLALRHEATLQAGPGETVVYTLTVRNAGGGPLPAVEVFAPIPEYIVDAREADNGGQVRVDQVYWAIEALGPNESRALTWRGTVDPLIPEGTGEIAGTGRASGAGLKDETRVLTRVPAQRVYLYKTATGLVWPGGVVDYSIVISNSGEATLHRVEVRDPLPNGIVGAANISHGGRLEGNTELVWFLEKIPAGEQVTLTWQGTVDPDISSGQGVIRNEVSLAAGSGLEREASAESVVENTSERLQLLLRHNVTVQAGPGETVAYTLTVRNAGGSDLPEVEVFAPIPEHIVDAREADNGGEIQADQVYWAVGTLGAGESRVLTWRGTVDPLIPGTAGEIVGTGRASGAGLKDETRVVTRILAQRAYLYATATERVWPGGAVDYGIVIRNRGEATLSEVEVRNPLPNGIIGAANISHGGQLEGNRELVWLLDIVPAGEQVTLGWQGTVDPDISSGQGIIRNEVSLSTGGGLELEASAESVVENTSERLQLLLRYDATIQAGPGETVVYTLTVRNAGGSPLPEVEVFAPIPEYITNAREATSGGQVRADQVYWVLGTLGAGESRALGWRGTVDPFIPEGTGEITALAQTSGAGLEDEARVVTRVPAQRVYLYKTATAQVWPGGGVDYGIVIRNRGEASLREVEVRNPLPNGITGAANVSHGGELEGNKELVWLLDAIPAGEQVTLTWRGTIDPALASGQKVIRSQVSLTTGGGLEREASAESAVLRSQLLLRKEATAQAGPGETVAYTLTVQNLSEDMTVPGVEVRDPIPAELTNPTGVNANGIVDFSEVIWKIGDLGPGERRVLTWAGLIPLTIPVSVTQISNQAGATDISGLKVTAYAATAVLKPAFRFSKTGPETAGAGETISYTLQLTNTGGPALRQVVITDTIPTYVLSATVTKGVIRDGVITWSADALLPGESLTAEWSGVIDRAVPATVAQITNRAQASARPGLIASALAVTRVHPPVLAVTKTGPNEVIPGQVVTYRIELANRGLGTIYHLRTEDMLSKYLLPQEISDNGYEVPGRIVWDALGDLAPGETVTLDWSGTVADDIPGGVFTLTNVARATAWGDVAVEARTDSQLLSPGLVLAMSTITATQAGGDLPYTIAIRNNGPGPARGVVVRDQIPAYVNPLPASLAQSGVTRAGDALVWEIGRMDAGAALTMTWTGQVDMDIPASVAQIANRAEASSFEQAGPIAAEAVTLLHDPNVRLSFACPAVTQAGETIPYQLRLTNAGVGALRALQVNLPASAGAMRYVAGSGSPAPDGSNPPAWTIGALATGASVDLAFAMLVEPSVVTDTVTREAQVTLAGRVVSWAGCTTRLAKPVLTLSKTAPATALLNAAIPYVLTVKNAGEVTAYRTVLTDTLPPATVALPGSVSDGGALGDTAIVWQLGDLAPGQVVSRTFLAGTAMASVTIPAGATLYDENGRLIINNTAAVSANRAEVVAASATTLGTRPTLTLRKTGDAMAGLGQTIVYTLTAGNEGPGLARLVSLQDRLPDGLVLQSDPSLEGGYYSARDNTVTWTLGDMPAGQVITRTLTMMVPEAPYPQGDILINRATLLSPDSSPAYGQATTGIYSEFELVATKRASMQSYPGGEIDYAIVLRNTGANLVGDVVVRDPLPAYTAYLDGSASLPPEYDPDAHALVWRLGTIASGETREIRFRLVVSEGLPDWVDRVTNEAEITFSGGSVSASAITLLPGAGLDASGVTPATPRPPSPSLPPSSPVGSGYSPVAPAPVVTASATPPATASSALAQALLPVSGGPFDPRTPGGKVVWAGALALLIGWWRVRKTSKSASSSQTNEEMKNDD